MHTSHITRKANSPWFTLGLAFMSVTLIALLVAIVLVDQFRLSIVPAEPAALASSPASARYAVFKQGQAEQVADAAAAMTPVWSNLNARYAALKDRQAEARDLTVVPAPAVERVGYAAVKQAQAEQVADAAISIAPVSINPRYAALKDAQAEARDLTVVPAK
jgi:hypothetical protein